MTTQQQEAPGGQQQEAPGGQQQQQEQTPEGQEPQGQEQPKTYDEDYVKELRQSEAKARTKLRKLEAEAEELRKANMSTDEKVVAEAEQRGRSAAAKDFGTRLARKEFDALAGRRNKDANTDELLEYVDLTKFVGEDGEPDGKAIQAAVERLVPAAGTTPPTFDGGTRTAPTPATSFSDTIRKAAGH